MLGVRGFKVNGPRHDVDVLENESEDTSVRPRWQDASGWIVLRSPRLSGIQHRVKVSAEFGAGPILRTNDFAVETAFAIDNISFRIHRGAVVERNFL